MNASSRQTWVLFCMTGFDVRACNLTLEKASELVGIAKSNVETAKDIIKLIPGAVLKNEKTNKQDFAAIYAEAHQAGMNAGNNHNPTPMTVCQRANPLDDNSQITKVYAPVMSGVCGFAWISFKGNTAWAKWAKKNADAHTAYGGGLNIWVHQFGQSMECKEKYADAFSQVLNKHGIKAYAGSRMD